jgi:hypothetical protein
MMNEAFIMVAFFRDQFFGSVESQAIQLQAELI